MMDRPLITVVVPTFKRADKIQRAVDSILGQQYSNLEVLIVDDNDRGSKEETVTLQRLERYVDDERVRIVHTEGSTGGGAARNYACKMAKGEYLAFLDDDDVFLPSKLKTQVSYMLENGLDMCYQDVEWVNEDGRLVEYRRLNHVSDFSVEGLLRAHVLVPIAPTATYMLTKELFDRTEGFGEVKVGQDWFLMLRCIEAGAKIGYLPGSYVHQYLHDGERLSLGKNKIEGENLLYEKKREYFHLLNQRERRYAEFRHYAVLAFACKRSGLIREAMKYFSKAFLTSPFDCIFEGKNLFFSKSSARKMPNSKML